MSFHSWLIDTRMGTAENTVESVDCSLAAVYPDHTEHGEDGVLDFGLSHSNALQPQPTLMMPTILEVVWQHRGVNTKHVLLHGAARKSARKTTLVEDPLQPSLRSRDQKCRPPILVATHSVNHKIQSQQKAKAMRLLSVRCTEQRTQQPAPSLSPKPSAGSSSPAEPPWRIYTDPMRQTSSEPHYWGTNFTTLKGDCTLESGNVISPTWMIGLPFGGMVEMAYYTADNDGVM